MTATCGLNPSKYSHSQLDSEVLDFLVLSLLDQYTDSTVKSKCGCGPSCLVRTMKSLQRVKVWWEEFDSVKLHETVVM